MSLWGWLSARPHGLKAIGACAVSGVVNSLALPLATWTISARPEGLVFLAVAAIYAALLAGAWWIEVRSTMAVHETVGEDIHRWRLSLIERVRTAELRFVEQRRGDLDDAMRDIEDLNSITIALQGYVKAGFELVGYVAYAFLVTGPAALALVAGLLWLARGMRRHARAQRAAVRPIGARDRDLGRAISDQWSGMPRFILDPRAMDEVQGAVRDRRHALTAALERFNEARVASTGFNTAQPLIVSALLALLATGPLGLTGPSGLAFVAIVFMTRGPTFTLLSVDNVVIAERAVQRLEAFDQALDAAQVRPATIEPPPIASLALEQVGFAFDGGFTLGPMSLTVEPGELVFVVGHNGSGKTTLMKVMSGLYPAQRGSVRLGGRPIGRDRLRAAFTVTFIDAYLFDRAYGLDVDDERIEAALAEVGLDGIVEVRDGVFDTLDLSTGQKRRLALAVALLEDRPVLIFDEWDAHQDPETKRWYFETLLPRLAGEGRIVVAVCHDARFFDAADRVIELEGGQLRAVRVRARGGQPAS